MNQLKLTLAIIKPDVVKVPFVLREIRQRILLAGFYIIGSRELTMSVQQAERFYREHTGRFFHTRLVTFMSSGPIHVHILAHPEAIQEWRTIMGPTKTYIAQFLAPSSIRGSFGLTDTRNSTHGSDSMESAIEEIKFFFPQFSPSLWYEKDEPLIRRGEFATNFETFTESNSSQCAS
nr:EOG090X0HUX [Ilyocryptus agilis]